MWRIHEIKYYSALRRNGSLIHGTARMNFKNIKLNAMSDTKEQ